MLFFRRLSLRSQLVLVVVCIVLAGFALTLSFLTHRMTQVQQSTALQYVDALARQYGQQTAASLRQALETTRTLAAAVLALRQTGHADRDIVNAMLRQALQANPALISVWTIWEPNAFDGRDAEFVRAPGHDDTGRYVPAAVRTANGGMQIDPVANYETPGVGDYYQLPKRTGRATLIEPFQYNLAGRQILQTAIAVPLQVDGRFVGVIGVGVALEQLQELVQNITVYDSGYVSLLSNQGVYVGDRDAGHIGQRLGADSSYPTAVAEALRGSIQAGTSHQVSFTDAQRGDMIALQVPLDLPGFDTPWSLMAVVPTAEVQQDVRQLQWLSLVLGVLSIMLTSLGLAVAVNRLVLRPIGGEPRDATALAARVAQGDLSHDITVQPGDQASLMFQLGQMQHSLAGLVAQVRQGAQTVALASAEISAGNQNLSSRTESQASALEETAAAMEQLGATVRQNADHAQDASQLAQEACAEVRRGGEAVAQVTQSMQGINDSSRKIHDIIGVVDSIAFQTNILALNAAVEAARAGEQGRGFAVVAGEVRTLAQRSAQAAREVKELISESVAQVRTGSAQVDAAGATMQQVVAAIERVSGLVQEISAASQEQSHGVNQVGSAVTQMDQDTQQNAALVEEMSAAAHSLREQAEGLVQTVEVFRTERDAPQQRAPLRLL